MRLVIHSFFHSFAFTQSPLSPSLLIRLKSLTNFVKTIYLNHHLLIIEVDFLLIFCLISMIFDEKYPSFLSIQFKFMKQQEKIQ